MHSSEWRSLPQEQRTLIESHQSDFPVKLTPLANALGLSVLGATLRPGFSGEIRPSPNGFIIRVNRQEPKVRQRFTVAHEIGHFLLHRDQIGDGIVDDFLYRSNLRDDRREAEANRLAADILMPRFEVERQLELYKKPLSEDDTQSLAAHFGVSTMAIRVRLGLV
jgi:hypothetical protein